MTKYTIAPKSHRLNIKDKVNKANEILYAMLRDIETEISANNDHLDNGINLKELNKRMQYLLCDWLKIKIALQDYPETEGYYFKGTFKQYEIDSLLQTKFIPKD
jgi:hypothetical protein